jgi:uncharacterized membrane protein YcjF (UPF0283 family)
MVSSRSQLPSCPVCQRRDQVIKLQTAYEAGLEHVAPPAMPVAKVPMTPFIITGFALIAVGVFFILILSGVGGYADWPGWVQVLQAVLTIAAIVAALLLSVIAFLRIGRGDLESQKLLPAWDRAMENWGRLYFCKRNDTAFDPQTNKALSDAEVKALISMDVPAAAQQVPDQTQSTAASHQ